MRELENAAAAIRKNAGVVEKTHLVLIFLGMWFGLVLVLSLFREKCFFT